MYNPRWWDQDIPFLKGAPGLHWDVCCFQSVLQAGRPTHCWRHGHVLQGFTSNIRRCHVQLHDCLARRFHAWYTKLKPSSSAVVSAGDPELGAVVQVEGVDGAAPPAKKPRYSLTLNDGSAAPGAAPAAQPPLVDGSVIARLMHNEWCKRQSVSSTEQEARSYSSPGKETSKNTKFNIEAQSFDIVYRYWSSICQYLEIFDIGI